MAIVSDISSAVRPYIAMAWSVSILYPPPLSPVGLRWSPVGLRWDSGGTLVESSGKQGVGAGSHLGLSTVDCTSRMYGTVIWYRGPSTVPVDLWNCYYRTPYTAGSEPYFAVL